MIRAGLVLVAVASVAHADPGWTDTSALMAGATAQIDAALRACAKKTAPFDVGFFATRTKTGTEVGRPLLGAGFGGVSAEDRCINKAVASLVLPPLPEGIDRVVFSHRVPAAGASTTDDYTGWNDVPTTLAGVLTPERRGALAACSKTSRTARLNLDVRKRKLTVWLPAWQFHAPSGDGSTPASEQPVKRCMTRVVATWTGTAFPRSMGDLQVSLATR